MWYNAAAFVVGWRDVLAAWAVCAAIAAALFGNLPSAGSAPPPECAANFSVTAAQPLHSE